MGLLPGGVITQAISWHWIFFVNLPIGIATAFFAIRLLPMTRASVWTAAPTLPARCCW